MWWDERVAWSTEEMQRMLLRYQAAGWTLVHVSWWLYRFFQASHPRLGSHRIDCERTGAILLLWQEQWHQSEGMAA